MNIKGLFSWCRAILECIELPLCLWILQCSFHSSCYLNKGGRYVWLIQCVWISAMRSAMNFLIHSSFSGRDIFLYAFTERSFLQYISASNKLFEKYEYLSNTEQLNLINNRYLNPSGLTFKKKVMRTCWTVLFTQKLTFHTKWFNRHAATQLITCLSNNF